jgi:hypothetical protein
MDKGLRRVLKPLPPVIPMNFEALCKAIVRKILSNQEKNLSIHSMYSQLEWTNENIDYELCFYDCGKEGDTINIMYRMKSLFTNGAYTGSLEKYAYAPGDVQFDAINFYVNRCYLLSQSAARFHVPDHAHPEL